MAEWSSGGGESVEGGSVGEGWISEVKWERCRRSGGEIHKALEGFIHTDIGSNNTGNKEVEADVGDDEEGDCSPEVAATKG